MGNLTLFVRSPQFWLPATYPLRKTVAYRALLTPRMPTIPRWLAVRVAAEAQRMTSSTAPSQGANRRGFSPQRYTTLLTGAKP